MTFAERILFKHIGKAYNCNSSFHPRYLAAMEEYRVEELTSFLNFLMKEGYVDSDVYSEPPTAIDKYLHPELR
jgi:hypothetical protein